jgi:hypothetical protein
MSLPAIVMPATLPDWLFAPHDYTIATPFAEVAFVTGQSRKRRTSTGAVQYLEAAMYLSATQAQIMHAFYETTLEAGSLPFVARSISPDGSRQWWHARFVSPPSWSSVATQNEASWNLSARLRLEGEAVTQQASNYVLLLNFEDNLDCEISGETFETTSPAAIETGIFSKCMDFNGTDPGGGGFGVCYNETVRTEWQLNDGEDFQIEMFVQLNSAPSGSARTLIKIGPNPNQNFINYYLQCSAGSSGNMRFSVAAPLSPTFVRTVSQDIPTDTAVHHIIATGTSNLLRLGIDGVCSSPDGLSYSNAIPAGSGFVIRLGNDSTGSNLAFNGRIDSVRMARSAIVDLSSGAYTVPTGPLTP